MDMVRRRAGRMERIVERKRGSFAQSDGISLAAFLDCSILKASCFFEIPPLQIRFTKDMHNYAKSVTTGSTMYSRNVHLISEMHVSITGSSLVFARFIHYEKKNVLVARCQSAISEYRSIRM